MRAFLTLTYGLIAYAVFLGSFLYAVAWLGDFAVLRTVDAGPETAPLVAILIDVALLTAFALQHSVMARPGFKRWWTRYVPKAVERSTYVLLASLLLFAICLFWRPLTAVVWQTDGIAAALLTGGFVAGWLIVLAATFMVSHFDLFGLRQVWLAARSRPITPPHFAETWFYRFVRHPIMLGFIIAFWSTATMTVGHLLFAVVTTTYILIALQFEERDLLAELGASYEDYRRRVGMLVPRPARPAPVKASKPDDAVTRNQGADRVETVGFRAH